MSQSFRLIGIPHLLIEHHRIDREVPPGESIAEHMASLGWAGRAARVTIDGRLIEDAQWESAVPQAGQSMVIRCVPQGPGGGGGKDATRMAVMLGVFALALAAPGLGIAGGALLGEALEMGLIGVIGPGTLGSIALSAGVGIGGMLAANALIPAPLPRRLTQEVRNEKSLPILA